MQYTRLAEDGCTVETYFVIWPFSLPLLSSTRAPLTGALKKPGNNQILLTSLHKVMCFVSVKCTSYLLNVNSSTKGLINVKVTLYNVFELQIFYSIVLLVYIGQNSGLEVLFSSCEF